MGENQALVMIISLFKKMYYDFLTDNVISIRIYNLLYD